MPRRRRAIGLTVLAGVAVVAALACRPRAPTNPPLTPQPPVAGVPVKAIANGEYVCEWTNAPITIDGKADEEAWDRAPVIDDFRMSWAGPDKRPKNATRAKLLWDREYLYFFADCDDPDLATRPTEHNGRVWEQDCFELFFKPAEDRPGYYEFEVSPANDTMEMYLPDRAKGSYDDFKNKGHRIGFKTAVTLRGELNKHTDGGGWSVEGRIRWADLGNTGGRPQVDERWRFSLCRVDFTELKKKEDLSTIAPLTKPSFHRHEEYATLRFMPPAGKFGIDQRPQWKTSKLVGFPEPPPPYRVERAFPNLKIKQPVYVAEDPGTNDLLVVQHLGNWAGPGKILRVKNDPAVDKAETIFESDNLIYALCFHPKYEQNGYVYLHSNGPTQADKKKNFITRYTMDRATGGLDPKSKLEIVEPFDSNGHNGGGIAFGPRDGLLYFTTGDTSSDSDVADRGQDLRYISSAVIRIDVDHPDAGKSYGVPKDNPFVGVKDARPEIWAHGFRNPWRMCFDEKTGTLWVGTNGQDLWEPVYVVHKGDNYGWPVYEGSHPFHAHRKLAPTKLAMPIIEHHHSEARSLTGGIVYQGSKFADLVGAYLYGDFSTGRIWGAWYDGQKITAHKEIAKTTCQIVNFYADKNGDVFVCDDAGDIYKLTPDTKERAAMPFPRLLSQTGLFTDTATHQADPALIPYDVNAPLYSDNAVKTRYIALPGDAVIDYAPKGGWVFPDGAALVKTFSIDTEAGNPGSRRRLETRVILRQLGNWTGYTYVWNDAQTDAELAPAEGLDQKLAIKDAAAPNGVREQTWRYPSRAECLVCHSRAANFVLGLNDLQVNRDFAYGNGRVDNQLRTLEHLGVLRVDWAGIAQERLRKELRSADRAADAFNTEGQRQAAKSSLLARRPQELPHLVDPADDHQDLNLRARSYLHANCAHCHVEAGGGNASVDLDFASDATKTKMFDMPAQSNVLGRPDAKLIATGHPENSILLHRMTTRGNGQMPPLATSVVDAQATRLIKEWIEKMPASTQPSK